MVFQFNDIGPLREGSGGVALKDRSAGTVVRYNRIEGGSRTLDLVDAQESFAAAQGSARVPHHARLRQHPDRRPGRRVQHDPLRRRQRRPARSTRKGTLYFYNNTVVVQADQAGPNARYRTALFDATSSDETIDARNNVIVVRPGTAGLAGDRADLDARRGQPQAGRQLGIAGHRASGARQGACQGRHHRPRQGDRQGSTTPSSRTRPAATSPSRPVPRRPVRPRRCPSVPVSLKATVDFEYVHPAAGRPRPACAAKDMGAVSGTGKPATAAPPAPAPAPPAPSSSPRLQLGARAPRRLRRPPAQPARSGPPSRARRRRRLDAARSSTSARAPTATTTAGSLACTGAKAGSPSVICVRAGAGSGGTGTAAAPFGIDQRRARRSAAEGRDPGRGGRLSRERGHRQDQRARRDRADVARRLQPRLHQPGRLAVPLGDRRQGRRAGRAAAPPVERQDRPRRVPDHRRQRPRHQLGGRQRPRRRRLSSTCSATARC